MEPETVKGKITQIKDGEKKNKAVAFLNKHYRTINTNEKFPEHFYILLDNSKNGMAKVTPYMKNKIELLQIDYINESGIHYREFLAPYRNKENYSFRPFNLLTAEEIKNEAEMTKRYGKDAKSIHGFPDSDFGNNTDPSKKRVILIRQNSYITTYAPKVNDPSVYVTTETPLENDVITSPIWYRSENSSAVSQIKSPFGFGTSALTQKFGGKRRKRKSRKTRK